MKFKRTAQFFTVFAILLSDAMCAMVTYNYCELQWGGKYAGWSAPPEMAFIYTIPFLICILACLLLAGYCRRRDRAVQRELSGKDWEKVFQKAEPLVKEYLELLEQRPRPDELLLLQDVCRACDIEREDALWVIREIRRGKNRVTETAAF